MFFYSQYDILILVGLVLSLLAQWGINSAYKKQSNVMNTRGISGADAARRILDLNGLSNVRVERVSGQLSDHYDPRTNVVRLSDGVHSSRSVAAVGIASHEAGHALQHNLGYAPIKMRNAILPVAKISSQLSVPLIFLGLIASFGVLVDIGILLFCGTLIFQLVTLPVEFNASRRAVKIIEETDMLSGSEAAGAKKVLRAAAMTYVAAVAVSALQLIRLIGISGRGRRRS